MATSDGLPAQKELYRSGTLLITDTSVRQGRYEAVAASRDSILSTYPRAGREVLYKFGLNGQSNEFPPGTEHTLYVRPRGGRVVSPVHTFGVEEPPTTRTPEESGEGEDGVAQVTFRVDLRPVLRAFARQGVYDPPAGPPIRREEFQGVYVVGDTEPLSWDRPSPATRMSDPDGDSIYTVTLPIPAEYTRPLAADGRAVWARRLDVSAFPQLHSPEPLIDALYRLSLEELQQLVREDGALAAGAKWPGVWTRDVSYASVLALALVVPDAVQKSLMAKVDPAGRIIQDTGTGGSWPVSTDRVTWALAAWELYAATGDREWLRAAHDIIRRSAEADLHAAIDPETGLVRGESSFLDWREQSYPRWMDPKDIYQSQALGTNAAHYATYRILADMARALGEPAERWDSVAAGIRDAINAHLWREDRGWYGQFRYGRNFQSVSPRSEALGEALSVIYGVATPERRARLARSAPVVEYGAPVLWPFIPGIPPYHNAALWPFVSAFATWAAAEAGNTAAVEHGLASIYRPAALFLTNKENMVAATGHFEGTELNSDRQLWSVAANLAASYRVLFGMRLEPERLAFRPMVPPAYGGERTLRGLRYRGAVLDVALRGHGDGVASVRLDGRTVQRAEIPATLTGQHTLEIELNGRWPAGEVNRVESRYSPAAPRVELRDGALAWAPVEGAAGYVVYRNGRVDARTAANRAPVRRGAGLAEYQVMAVDAAGLESFLSEPVRVEGTAPVLTAKPAGTALEREHEGFTGPGYLPLTVDRNTTVTIPVQVPRAGEYAIDVRYANGSGPVNTDSKAAVRTLRVGGREAGVLVMPQRGGGLWSEWGYSNALRVRLAAGSHSLTIAYTPLDRNMDGAVNTALLDHVRLTPLEGDGEGVGR